MAKLHDDSRGAISILVLIFVIALVYGGYVLFIKKGSNPDSISTQDSSIYDTELQSVGTEDDNHARVISLQPANNYDARGKVTIEENKYGQVKLSLSLALPSEADGTYYEAYLEGEKKVYMGRLGRDGGLYKLSYTLKDALSTYSNVVIIVDGAARTVEGKSLPHEVMVGGLY